MLPCRYFQAARQAFELVISSLDFHNDQKLLLPAYIGITDREGSGVYDPVLETATPHEFYPVNERLGAIEERLYELIESGKYKALLIIHYFGFCQNRMDIIVKLCKQNDVVLIEDCAHTMLSSVAEGDLGCLGDFSFYSIHKYLAAENGGCLKINNPKYFNVLQYPYLGRNLLTVDALEIILKSDLELIRSRRRENYLYLSNLIDAISGIELMFGHLPQGIAPHNLPLIVHEGRREDIYFKLVDDGVPAIALYYRLISPIVEGGFDSSIKVSDNILNLPIHQDVTTADLEFVAKSLRTALSS